MLSSADPRSLHAHTSRLLSRVIEASHAAGSSADQLRIRCGSSCVFSRRVLLYPVDFKLNPARDDPSLAVVTNQAPPIGLPLTVSRTASLHARTYTYSPIKSIYAQRPVLILADKGARCGAEYEHVRWCNATLTPVCDACRKALASGYPAPGPMSNWPLPPPPLNPNPHHRGAPVVANGTAGGGAPAVPWPQRVSWLHGAPPSLASAPLPALPRQRIVTQQVREQDP